ncbi:MAG: hypothetical protein OHK0023_18460 [Anaerolineae bacterium]
MQANGKGESVKQRNWQVLAVQRVETADHPSDCLPPVATQTRTWFGTVSLSPCNGERKQEGYPTRTTDVVRRLAQCRFEQGYQ